METPPDPSLAYRGTILRYSPASGSGKLRSATGREVDFDLRFLRLHPSFRGDSPERALSEGMIVGFDVGWTSRGLLVSRIFPFPDEGVVREENPSGK